MTEQPVQENLNVIPSTEGIDSRGVKTSAAHTENNNSLTFNSTTNEAVEMQIENVNTQMDPMFS